MFGKKKKTEENSLVNGIEEEQEVIEPTSKKKSGQLPAILSVVICASLIAGILFVAIMVIQLNVLPAYLLIAVGLIIAGLAFICVALTWSTKKPVRFSIGVFLSIVMLGGMIVGGIALKKAWDTARKVTTASVTLAEVGVYVNNEDSATAIEDLSGYTFGILKASDRDDADKALLNIASDLNSTVFVSEYDSVIKLISAL